MKENNTFNPKERAAAKQASREKDTKDLEAGLKTREQLRAERKTFVFTRMCLNLKACKKLA